MMQATPSLRISDKVLFYGIGNPTRQDDSLGIKLIEMLQESDLPDNFTFETAYQLNAEDSLLISQYDVVFFADASERKIESDFLLTVLNPSDEIAFSTHAMSPKSILGLCIQLYNKTPQVYLLEIPGSQWEFGEQLSAQAQHNLQKAYLAIRDFAVATLNLCLTVSLNEKNKPIINAYSF